MVSLDYNKYFRVVIVFAVLFSFSGCSRLLKKEDELIGAQFYFDRGVNMLKKNNYQKATENFQVVVDSYPGEAIVDHAQFMLGESHFKNEEYDLASYEYERLYSDYPASKWAPDAQYKIGLCYFMESPDARLDQENTLKAILAFNRFIDTFPSHPLAEESQAKIQELKDKLALKEFRSADLYRKMKNYEAALIYYNYILEEYPRSVWADYSRYGIGRVHYKQQKYETAKGWFQLVMNAETEADLKDDAKKLLDKIKDIEAK